jgi:FixJ family two-component response regulator
VAVNKKQIYIVDDDESVCRALGTLLVTYGFKVDTFTSAENFFHAVPNDIPGCLLLDIHMPGLDGWETLKRIVESGFNRPVILVSANKNGGLNKKAVMAGAVGFLQKPFNDQALVDLINISVGKSSTDKTKEGKSV